MSRLKASYQISRFKIVISLQKRWGLGFGTVDAFPEVTG